MTEQKRHQAGAPASQGGQYAPDEKPEFDGELEEIQWPGEEPANYRYLIDGRTLVYDQPVIHDYWGYAQSVADSSGVEPLSSETPFDSPVSRLQRSDKLPPSHRHMDQDRYRISLAALDNHHPENVLDEFVGTIMDGHLSRGTAGKSGATAARAWRDEARNRYAASGDDRHEEFAQGVDNSAILLMGSKLGIESDAGYGDSHEETAEMASQAIEIASTRRASADDREQWRKYLPIAPSEAHWRGMMVGAAALSGTDSWWGFRDDIDKTILWSY